MTDSKDEQLYRIEDPASTTDNNAETSTDAPQAPRPAAVPPTPPTSAGEPPRQSGSNKGLWITIAILAAIILVGGTWIAASHFMQPAEAVPADTVATDTNAVEVVSYETDDTPTEDPNAVDPNAPIEEESALRPHVADFVGTITATDGDGIVSVGLSITFEGSGSVQGTSKNGDHSYSISGRYDSETHRLLVYEDGGGHFDGTLHEDGKYIGKYHGASETPSEFSLTLATAR